jgi:hypothetical protein
MPYQTQAPGNPLVVYNLRFITAAESWYSAPVEPCSADIIQCLQLDTPLPGSRTSEFQTIWIDLTKSEHELLAAVHKVTRNRIRRAAQDNLCCDYWDVQALEQCDAFCSFFEQHRAHDGSLREVRRWTRAHAEHLTLGLSRIADSEGRTLVWHAYYRDAKYARGKYSVSISREANPELRALVGRANRYLTWEDIKRFKANGLSIYDLGGWYAGKDDQKLLAVNNFKEQWGGRIMSSFHCTRALTLKGAIFLWAANLRDQLSRKVQHAAKTR